MEHDPTKRRRPKRNEIWVLEEVSEELNSAQQLDRVIEVVMDTMTDLFDVRHLSVYLTDTSPEPADRAPAGSQGQRLCLASQRGEPGRDQRLTGQRDMRMGSGMIGTAAGKREIVRLNRRRGALVGNTQDRLESFLAVPMLAKGVVVGVLAIETDERQIFSKADEQLVAIISNQAAVAIQNARLFEDLQGLNRELEARVAQRTAELEKRHRELQETQLLLVQSGKMAALGQLVAGLSHELNTPLGAMRSSIDVAERARAMIHEGEPKASKGLRALEKSHRVTQEACDRVFGVFAALRRFVHLDEAALQRVSLHDGLESALELLAHRIEDDVEVDRKYGALERVCCYAGEINQVFLIVLSNALDALETTKNSPKTITLRSRQEGTNAIIEIRDNGCGIDQEHLGRIFDPGFTTKGVGVGSGLSLGIAFRTMEKHGGRITVESQPSQGTSVCIQLPFEPASKAQD